MSPSARGRGRPRRDLGELVAVAQVPRLVARLPGLVRSDRSAARRDVVVLPGRGVDDMSTWPLRWVLARRGHRVQGWGLGVDDGDVDRLLPLVEDLLVHRAERVGGPLDLVGQSLGGFLAREAARRRPDAVRAIVTLGTPLFRPRSAAPLAAPVVALWSEADRIVPPGRARDRDPGTTMVEVGSSHMGMGLDPDVIALVARSLEGPT